MGAVRYLKHQALGPDELENAGASLDRGQMIGKTWPAQRR
jgi:hypothetical protein